jgi:signal transduction histidine kinase
MTIMNKTMKSISSLITTRSAVRNLGFLQWLIPIGLSLTAIGAELLEHQIGGELNFDALFFWELLTFGLFGPIIVGSIIVYLRRLVAEELHLHAELQNLNRGLEARVQERTAELEDRNDKLARANTELQQLDQLKSDFVSLVSHELRAPLTALNGGLELALQQSQSLPAEARRTLETMMDESERLTFFVQTILDLSRLDAGKLRITPGPVAVPPLLRRAVEIVLSASKRPVEWDLGSDLPPLWADETVLEEAFRNLLRNADKYSPAGLPVVVSAAREEDHIHIRVGDYGQGIPDDIQPYIFERFYRGTSTENLAPGWGLGLFFARRLTEAQGGKLSLRSPSRKDPKHPGSEFTLTLPIASEPEDEDV